MAQFGCIRRRAEGRFCAAGLGREFACLSAHVQAIDSSDMHGVPAEGAFCVVMTDVDYWMVEL